MGRTLTLDQIGNTKPKKRTLGLDDFSDETPASEATAPSGNILKLDDFEDAPPTPESPEPEPSRVRAPSLSEQRRTRAMIDEMIQFGDVPDPLKAKQYGESMGVFYRDPQPIPEAQEEEPSEPPKPDIVDAGYLTDFVEGAIQGGLQFVGGAARVLQLADLNDPMLSQAAQAYSGSALRREQAIQEQQHDPYAVREALRGAVSSLVQMAPGAFTFGPAGAIVSASTTTANNAITEGIDAGLTGKALEQYVSEQTALEALPAATMSAAGLGGLEKILGSIGKAGTKQVMQRGVVSAFKDFSVNFAAELPEELITELGQNLSAYANEVDTEAMDGRRLAEDARKVTLQTFFSVGLANATKTGSDIVAEAVRRSPISPQRIGMRERERQPLETLPVEEGFVNPFYEETQSAETPLEETEAVEESATPQEPIEESPAPQESVEEVVETPQPQPEEVQDAETVSQDEAQEAQEQEEEVKQPHEMTLAEFEAQFPRTEPPKRFKESKVQDEVYHGGEANDIREFFTRGEDLGGNTGSSSARLGAFFSESRDLATAASFGFSPLGSFGEPTKTLYTVRLNLRNPLELDSLTQEEIDRLEKAFPGFQKRYAKVKGKDDKYDLLGLFSRSREKAPKKPNFATFAKEKGLSNKEIEEQFASRSGKEFEEWDSIPYVGRSNGQKLLKSLGYDGIILSTRASGSETPLKEYIVFDPNNASIVRKEPVISHRIHVQDALEQGKPVPDEVLADYPDLSPARIGSSAQPTQRERTLSNLSERAQQLEQEPTGQVSSEEILNQILKDAPKEIVLTDEWNDALQVFRQQFDTRKQFPGRGIRPPQSSGLSYEDLGLSGPLPNYFRKDAPDTWDTALEVAYELGLISEEERTEPSTLGRLLTGTSRIRETVNLGEKEQAQELYGGTEEAIDALTNQRNTLRQEGADTSTVDRLIEELEDDLVKVPQQDSLFTEEENELIEEEDDWLFNAGNNLTNYQNLAKMVIKAARHAPKEGKLGEKTLISEVHKQLQKDTGQKIPLETFKNILLTMNQEGMITLSRLDLVAAFDDRMDMVRASEISQKTAQGADQFSFHFIRHNDPQGLVDKGPELQSGRVTGERVLPLEAVEGIRPVSIGEMRQFVRTHFDVTLRGKATKRASKAVGRYEVNPEIVRVFRWDDLDTLAHEAAHRLNHLWWGRTKRALASKQFTPFKDELGPLDYDQEQQRTYEGFAEYMRYWLFHDPVHQWVPRFHKWFHEEFLPTVPEDAKKLHQLRNMYLSHRGQGAKERTRQQMRWRPEKKKFRQRVVDAYLRLLDLFVDNFATQEYLLAKEGFLVKSKRNLSKRYKKKGYTLLDPAEHPVEIGRFAKEKAPSMARTFVLEYAFDSEGNRVGPGLASILRGIRAQDMEDFELYMFNKRSLNLHRRGIYPGIHFLDAQYNVERFERDHPDWEGKFEQITSWAGTLLQHLVDAGGLSESEKQRMQALNPLYFPFNRILDTARKQSRGGEGYVNRGKPVKAIRGAGEPIEAALTALMEYSERIISAANKVKVARAWARIAETHNGVGNLITKLPAPIKADKKRLGDIIDVLKKSETLKRAEEEMGEDLTASLDDLDTADLDEVLTFWTQAPRYNGKDNIVAIWRNGKQQYYEVHEDLYRQLQNMDAWQVPWGLGWLAKLARIRKLGAVQLRAGFSLVNFMRDAFGPYLLNRDYAGSPFSPQQELYREMRRYFGRDDELLDKFYAGGGRITGFIGHDLQTRKHLRDELIARASGSRTRRAAVKLRHPIDGMREIMSATESASRIGEFRAAYKWAKDQGMSDESAWIHASNSAADVTINFTRSGSIGRVINTFIPFWNVAIQEPSKMKRQLQSRPVKTISRGIFYLTAPTMALWWLFKDDERYRELAAWEKAMHWNWWVGDTHFELPKPFGWGHVFASNIEAILSSWYDEDPELVKDMIGASLNQQIPSILLPGLDVYTDIKANETWAGVPIIPQSQEFLPAPMQYSEWTPQIYREIGKQLNVSPRQLEYVTNQMTGGALGALGRSLDAGQQALEGKTPEGRNIPAIGRFFGSSKFQPSRSQDLFYRELGELKTWANGITDDTKDTPENRKKIDRLATMETVARELSEINRQLKAARSGNDNLEEDALRRAKAQVLWGVLDRYPKESEILDTRP